MRISGSHRDMVPLLGRDHELSEIVQSLDRVYEHGTALTIRAEAGMGKSVLLAAARQYGEQRGFSVLATTGVQSETMLPFAGLHHLLRPILQGIEALPVPQRDAMRVAFGMSAGVAPDLFFAGLATLNLLGEASAKRPILLLVDDSQWLDRSTSDVLAFVARRLEQDPVVMLVAVRNEHACSLVKAAPRELRLEPLTSAASAALLEARAPDLSRSLRERVLREAAGNPLALTELPAALKAAGLKGDAWLPTHLPLTTRLERAFAARVAELPEYTHALLLVAAADEAGNVSELLQATTTFVGHPVSLDMVYPAVSAGLIEANETDLRFVHPLMRSAVYQTVATNQRQRAHAALAAVLTHAPDRRAWHLAASVTGADEAIAAELEEVAERAQLRGSSAVAVKALEHAARLSATRAEAGRRLLTAARRRYDLGQHDEVVRLLLEAERHTLRPRDVQWLLWYREVFMGGTWSGAERARGFAELADQMRLDGDAEGALDALQAIALRCYWSNADRETQEILVAAAERVPVSEDDPKLLNILALVGPEQRGAVVLDRLSRVTSSAAERDPDAAFLLGDAASAVGDFRRSGRFLEAAAAGLRAQGRLGLLAQVLNAQACASVPVGNWSLGRHAAEEAARLAAETAQPLYQVVANLTAATIAAYRGDTVTAEALAAGGEQVLLPIGAHTMLSLVQYPRGVAALSAGRHVDAYEHLRRIFDPSGPAYHPFVRAWALVDLVEAAVHCDRREEARTFVGVLEPLAEQTRSPLLRVGLLCASPLLAEDDDAESLFQAGFGTELRGWPFQWARLQLAYGAWLRRRRRVAESRGPLREARDAFDALGAAPWAERARGELRASGEASRSRPPGAWDSLTAQELQIAQMASAGMTNKEIGQHLFLSHRTVGSHLYRLFPKLGITARSQLRDALKARPGTLA